jgi:hypothetical protein
MKNYAFASLNVANYRQVPPTTITDTLLNKRARPLHHAYQTSLHNKLEKRNAFKCNRIKVKAQNLTATRIVYINGYSSCSSIIITLASAPTEPAAITKANMRWANTQQYTKFKVKRYIST